MTVPEDEQAQDGPGDFRDVVDVQLADDSLALVARIARAPSLGTTGVMVAVVVDGEPVAQIAEEIEPGVESWEHAAAGPLEMRVEQPLERWTLTLDSPGAGFTIELRALTPPADLTEPSTAAIGRATGLHRYAQLCEARGTAEVAGRRFAIETLAIRTHRWGSLGETGRARFLTAAAEDGTLLTVAAARPSATEAHGDELVGGHTLRPTDGAAEPLPFETVRLSTVFGEDGLPLTAGAELFRPGEEYPNRLAGAALGGGTGALQDSRTSLSLFRFSLDGVRAVGSYEIESSA